MNYYKRNREAILKKAHDKYHNGGGKEKAYYRENKEEIKKRERKRYREMVKFERKDKIKRSLGRYYRLKKKRIIIKMNNLVFGDIALNKKEFYENKKDIKLKHVNVDNIVIINKIKINDDIKYEAIL